MNLFFKNHLFPVQGKCKISNDYSKGYKIRNEGIDIATYNQNNEVTIYKNLQRNSIKVKEGQHVKKGQVIANVGSGDSKKSLYLHYEQRKNNIPQQPAFSIDKNLTNLIKN